MILIKNNDKNNIICPPSRELLPRFKNNNNNNSHDNVYGAVIMTRVIARVHPVDLMNVD